MRDIQSQIIETLSVRPTIDPASEIRARVDFLKQYAVVSAATGFVLGISGGQDSSLAGRLCQLAVEELRAGGMTAHFAAVRLPYGVQHDEDDAQLALDFIAPDESITFNIKRGVDGVDDEFRDSVGVLSDFTKGNAKARLRMVAQYAIAGERGALVVGTDHAAEAITGFFTKFGDGGADILPLSGLTKRQGKALLQQLDAPERLYLKAPTADLLDELPGQTDEANLGVSYQVIDDYLEGKDVDEVDALELERRYASTQHKRQPPVSKFDRWWRSGADL